MLNKLPDTVSMSEPWALYYAHVQYHKGHITPEEYPRIVRGLLRVQLKPFSKVGLAE